MQKGYIHFDVSRGLLSELLVGASADLLEDLSPIKLVFDILGLSEISFQTQKITAHGMLGTVVHFYVGNSLIDLGRPIDAKPLQTKPLWEKPLRPPVMNKGPKDPSTGHHAIIEACLNGEDIALHNIKNIFMTPKVKPTVAAIAQKVIDNLENSAISDAKIKNQEALWFLCHLVALVSIVDALDPKFVTASKIALGQRNPSVKFSSPLSVLDPRWLDQVLIMMPVIEKEGVMPSDVLAAAFLKTLSASFGPRGESTILRVGIGHDHGVGHGYMGEVLWCEAKFPESIKEYGPGNKALISHLYEVTGLLKTTVDMAMLSIEMMLHGAASLTWFLAHGDKQATFYQASFFCSDIDKREAIEAFLIKAEALDVRVTLIEHHQLNRILVCVPIGHGNKATTARFYEYMYYDKTVRVEPLKEDLDAYIKKTNYSMDVARSDLLMAWKKWRGRVAKD